MKKILLIIVTGVLLNSCMLAMLDEGNQEKYQSDIQSYYDDVDVIVVKEYYDENGDEITDPVLIAEIENRE